MNQAEAISTSLGSEVANLEQSLSELRRSCAEDVAANVKYALGPHLRQAEGYSGRGSFALRKAAVTVHLPDTNVLSAAGVPEQRMMEVQRRFRRARTSMVSTGATELKVCFASFFHDIGRKEEEASLKEALRARVLSEPPGPRFPDPPSRTPARS